MPRSNKRISVDELSGCTCLRLRKVTRRMSQIYERFLEAADLTGPQFSILGSVHRRPNIAPSELAELLATDPTTLTRNLRPLERRGLLKIVNDPSDRRRRAVALTREGRASLQKALPQWRRAQACVLDLLGADDVARLNQMMDHALPRLAKQT